MKHLSFLAALLIFCYSVHSQTRQGDILSQERCKEITEYYCKQYIVDDILQIPDRKSTGVHISAITAAKSGELTTVLYQCNSLNKKGVVFTFWNDYATDIALPYKGYGFYGLDFDQAKELFSNLEMVLAQDNNILDENMGNLVYKSDDLTFLIYNKNGEFGSSKAIRVWWKTFDSDWTIKNLETTIKRFKVFFGLAK